MTVATASAWPHPPGQIVAILRAAARHALRVRAPKNLRVYVSRAFLHKTFPAGADLDPKIRKIYAEIRERSPLVETVNGKPVDRSERLVLWEIDLASKAPYR